MKYVKIEWEIEYRKMTESEIKVKRFYAICMKCALHKPPFGCLHKFMCRKGKDEIFINKKITRVEE